jgi:hypothetical protein
VAEKACNSQDCNPTGVSITPTCPKDSLRISRHGLLARLDGEGAPPAHGTRAISHSGTETLPPTGWEVLGGVPAFPGSRAGGRALAGCHQDFGADALWHGEYPCFGAGPFQLPRGRIDDLHGQSIALGSPALQLTGGALMRPDPLQTRKVLPRCGQDQGPPWRSGTAEWTTTARSQRLCIHQDVPLAPGEFLGPIKATYSAGLGLDGLTVDHGSAGRRISACMQARQFAQMSVDWEPGAVPAPLSEVIIDRLPVYHTRAGARARGSPSTRRRRGH